jgi:hypothetical protein
MDASSIVSVTITRETQAVSQAGFGVAAFVSAGAAAVLAGTTRVAYYSSLAEVVAAGFATNSAEYKAAQQAFGQELKPERFAIISKEAGDADYAAALSAAVLESNDWYAFGINSRVTADILNAAAWAEANKKLFGTSDDDANTVDLSFAGDADVSLAKQLHTLGYDRTFGIYHDESDGVAADDERPEIAAMGRMLPTTPGSATWMFKTLAGVSVMSLTTTQSGNARDKNFNTYESVGGVSILREGKVASGEYIDVIIGVDWLEARIIEAVYSRLVNLAKIPFTDAGIAIVENEIRAVLNQGVQNGFLAANPAPIVRVPLASEVSTNDKANRILPDIYFEGTLAGAVHGVTIQGVVKL